MAAYRALLGRAPGRDEPVAQWVGQPLEQLYGQLAGSQEFRDRRRAAEPEDVAAAYQALLGRAPGRDEPVAQWVGQPLGLMYETIANSPEYLAHQSIPAPLRSTVREPQLNPPVETWEEFADDPKLSAIRGGFKEFTTAHKQTLVELNQYGSAYAAQLYALFDGLIDRDTRCVVEHGSGLSTLIIQELLMKKAGTAKDLIFLSIDHNESWQRRVARALPSRSFSHLRNYDLIGNCEATDDFGFNYATAPQMLRRKVGLAFVDGRTRAQSVLAVATCLDEDGVVVLDDGERERYGFLDQYFKHVEVRGRFKIFRGPAAAPRRTPRIRKKETKAILRVISGAQAEIEAAVTRDSVKAYAKKIGAELVDVKESSEGEEHPLPKLNLSSYLVQYDRIMLIDCDLLIRRNTHNLFELVPSSHVGAVREDRYINRSCWLNLMADLYQVPAPVGTSLPYFNSGVMLLSREHYGLLSLPVEGTLFAHPLFEQTYLNARVRELGIPLYELPKEFNYVPEYDSNFDFDWRFGWIIHLAGGQQSVTDAWRRKEFWEEIHNKNGISVRRQSKLLFRHVRIPYLRCLAEAVAQGFSCKIMTAPDFEFKSSRRIIYLPEHGVVGVDLAGAAKDVIVSGSVTGLQAGAYRGQIRLVCAADAMGPVTFDLRSAGVNSLIEKTTAEMDEEGDIQFRFVTSGDSEFELRIWGCKPGIFLETLTLMREVE